MNTSKPGLIKQLPLPPSGKKGWPWTEESPVLPPLMPDGDEWPKISIVTPSFNQGRFIEETIRSVLLQNYPNLEYIIMDGGSDDESVAIIKKYEPWLTYWVSEKDEGQSAAINSGFEKSSGDVMAWINSDDFYYPECFRFVGENIPTDINWGLIYGRCYLVDKYSKFIRDYPVFNFDLYSFASSWASKIPQQAVFLSRNAVIVNNGLNSKLHYAMDFDLWLKIATFFKVTFINYDLAAWRYYEGIKSKSGRHLTQKEILNIYYRSILNTSFPFYLKLFIAKGIIKLSKDRLIFKLKDLFGLKQ